MNKNFLIIILVLIVVVVGGYFFWQSNYKNSVSALPESTNQNQQTPTNYEIQGMKIEVLQQGSGDPVKSGDKVTVNYVGTLEDGTKFDSSIDRGQPFTFTPGENSVIQGWELGVAGMKIGEKRKLTIPPELAYGEWGAGGVIPPNATLIFEIDLLGIN
ncbi:MAG: FKBP-type peptidyl-prolyl cis-trans isomerase [bacterium]